MLCKCGCGREIISMGRYNKKFFSSTCKNRHYSETHRPYNGYGSEMSCKKCGKTYVKSLKNQKYCSLECRLTYRYEVDKTGHKYYKLLNDQMLDERNKLLDEIALQRREWTVSGLIREQIEKLVKDMRELDIIDQIIFTERIKILHNYLTNE